MFFIRATARSRECDRKREYKDEDEEDERYKKIKEDKEGYNGIIFICGGDIVILNT